MCRDYLRLGVGSCGKPYAPGESRCQVKVLMGADGEPNGYSKCPSLGHAPCTGEADKK